MDPICLPPTQQVCTPYIDPVTSVYVPNCRCQNAPSNPVMPACPAGTAPVCTALKCQCEALPAQAAAGVICEVRVVFPGGDPSAAQLVTYPGCAGAGMELAIAVVLAKLLGAP